MKILYIIATSWQGLAPEIYTTHQSYKAVKHISERMDWDHGAHPDDDPQELLSEYYDWVRNVSDNQCETDITMEVFEY